LTFDYFCIFVGSVFIDFYEFMFLHCFCNQLILHVVDIYMSVELTFCMQRDVIDEVTVTSHGHTGVNVCSCRSMEEEGVSYTLEVYEPNTVDSSSR